MCLSCSRALHRPCKFGLDGQACCKGCRPALPTGDALLEDMVTRLVLVWLDICRTRWPARFMAAGYHFLRPVDRLLGGACVSALHEPNMPAAAVLQPVALQQAAPVFAAVILRWLHDSGDRALLATDLGVWARGLLIAGTPSSYDNFAEVDACPLPCPALPSLASSGFLAASGPPCPAPHPVDEWQFAECNHNL